LCGKIFSHSRTANWRNRKIVSLSLYLADLN
jgi:hypothetical protein